MQHFTEFSAATQSLLVMGHQFCDLAEDMTQCNFSLLVSFNFLLFRSVSSDLGKLAWKFSIVAESQIYRMQNLYEKITEHLYFAFFFFL